MNTFKEKCIALRSRDYTLPEIVKVTGRSKTSVYFHIKNIPLSEKKLREVSKNSRRRAQQIADSRRGKALRSFSSFENWSENLVLLVSHLLFDGEISNTTCGYSNRSKSLIKRVDTLLSLVYPHRMKYDYNQITGVISIRCHNVELASYLKHKSKELLQNISTMPRSFQREFLRAFFDDEGCMDFRPTRHTKRIRGYQKDKKILKLVKSLLLRFDVESSVRGKNEIVIVGKENLEKFQKEINFSEGVRINPKRTNSIWKKDIEKRELLRRAIQSYKT